MDASWIPGPLPSRGPGASHTLPRGVARDYDAGMEDDSDVQRDPQTQAVADLHEKIVCLKKFIEASSKLGDAEKKAVVPNLEAIRKEIPPLHRNMEQLNGSIRYCRQILADTPELDKRLQEIESLFVRANVHIEKRPDPLPPPKKR